MRALLLALVTLVGCASRGPVFRSGEPQKDAPQGVATGDTWVHLEPFGARMRAPRGWRYERKGDAWIVAPKDGKAGLAFTGAASKDELATRLRALGALFSVEKMELRPARPIRLHGMEAQVLEATDALVGGKPAGLALVVAKAPHQNGLVIVLVLALDEVTVHDAALIEAANSLRPA